MQATKKHTKLPSMQRVNHSPSEKNASENVVCLLKLSAAQGSHRLEKYLNLKGFLEKSLKIKYALKSTGKSFKCLEKSLNSSIFGRT